MVDKNTKYLSVGEVAKILGVTTTTLRNWDKEGKLKASRNPINNYRVYKWEDIEAFMKTLDLSKRKPSKGSKKIFLG